MRADGASPYYAQPQAERPRRERLVSDTTLSIESRVRLDQTSLVGRDEPERNHFLYATKYLPRRDSTLYPVTVAGDGSPSLRFLLDEHPEIHGPVVLHPAELGERGAARVKLSVRRRARNIISLGARITR